MKEDVLISPDSFSTILLMFFLILAKDIVYEGLSWHWVYSKEQYTDLCEKTRNVGAHVKRLKDQLYYGQDDQKKRK